MTYEILLENDDKENYVFLATIGSTDVVLWKTQTSGVPRGVGVSKRPSKFRIFEKAEPNFQFRGKYTRNNVIRIRRSLIYKYSGTPE
jgi:hypothetical protein